MACHAHPATHAEGKLMPMNILTLEPSLRVEDVCIRKHVRIFKIFRQLNCILAYVLMLLPREQAQVFKNRRVLGGILAPLQLTYP